MIFEGDFQTRNAVMITQIKLQNVASYKGPTVLSTDKRVNLIYGLNGSGKTTLSNFLYDVRGQDFSECSVSGIDSSTELFVYNQKFIRDNFYESDELPGIFTLSKVNKEAEQKIRNATSEIERLNSESVKSRQSATDIASDKETVVNRAKDSVWKIKTDYSGGDRVMEYCLKGFMREKGKLLDYIAAISKPNDKPSKTVEQLKSEVEAVVGDSAQSFSVLPMFSFDGAGVETDSIFQKEIAGNQNSTVASLIERLGNSDWVKDGLRYIEESKKQAKQCPFCQSETITADLIAQIKSFFDKSYEDDINEIETLKGKYIQEKSMVVQWAVFEGHGFLQQEKSGLQIAYNKIIGTIDSNIFLINEKLKSPGRIVTLVETASSIKFFNELIDGINIRIEGNNQKIAQKDETLEIIKSDFWNLMRWEYDQSIGQYQVDIQGIEKREKALAASAKVVSDSLSNYQQILREEQRKTVNVEAAILSINAGLIDLGIDGFTIAKQTGNFYRIERVGQTEETFHTLSEGEKMIISFLYFLELCKGKRSAESTATKKVVVIDDPISSLSHIYIFNVAQLIKTHFTDPRSKCEQVFILTHSLYFFYDLTMTSSEKRKETQNLFRIVKDSVGSKIENMKYESIQNDYHAYWQVINDPESPPALLANCMRNVIEYFFGFVEKQPLHDVFDRKEFKLSKYQAFYRYMNRESHSIGQNIFDLKEFDHGTFKDAFKLVFETSGFGNHYKKMTN